jgi:hypothetical protein
MPTATKTPTKASTKARKARKAPRRKAAAAKAASTPRVSASVSNGRADFGDYAQRAVLIPVGAALVARDRVVTSVNDTISTYSSSSKTQAQLRRFERRGVTARKRLEREVRKARVRVERELRQRRRAFRSTVNDLEGRRDSFAKDAGDIAGRVPELAKDLQERVLSLV